jgi:hypothetical protein
MASFLRPLVALFLLIAAAAAVLALVPAKRVASARHAGHGGSPASPEPLPNAVFRSQFAPYYTVQEGWRAVLGLNNTTRAPFDVMPTVCSLEGVAAVLPPIRLEAHEHKMVDIAELVAGLGEQFHTGSLRADFVSVGNGLGAHVSLLNERESLLINIMLRSHAMHRSSKLEAIWWAPTRHTQVRASLSNTTDEVVTARVAVSDAAGREFHNRPVRLRPHQTHVVPLRTLIGKDAGAVGGISIQHDGPPGAVMAHGFAFERNSGFSANIHFEDPGKLADAKLEGAGVILGADPEAPALEFSGHLLLRNVGPEPLLAEPVLQRGPSIMPLGTAHLAPGETREIRVPAHVLPAAIAGEPEDTMGTGIQISHTGAPGSLLANWFSVDQSRDLVVETPFQGPPPNSHGGGNNPVTLEGDAASILFVKNTGQEKAVLLANFRYHGGEYTVGLRDLGPGETYTLDFRKLRDQQVPDDHGRLLPLDVEHGQVYWRRYSGPPLIGRTHLLSRSRRWADSMACFPCNCHPADVWMGVSPGSWSKLIGESQPHSATKYENGCYGLMSYSISPGSWSSANPPAIPVSGSGVASCSSPANASITGHDWATVYYSYDPWGGCEVQNYAIAANAAGACATTFNVAHSSYIPVNYVVGPTTCNYQGSSFFLKYKGDAFQGTYRTAHSINVTPALQQSSGLFMGVGQTRNYGAGSPANGSTLSSADEDGVASDCLLWNWSASGSTSGYNHQVSYPASQRGQVRLWGMTVLVNASVPSAPTATITYTHTCYPAHQVKVNGQELYHFQPGDNSQSYIFQCLFLKQGTVQSQIGPMAVFP